MLTLVVVSRSTTTTDVCWVVWLAAGCAIEIKMLNSTIIIK